MHQKQDQAILQNKLKKTRASNILQLCPWIWENEHINQLDLRRNIFISNTIYELLNLKNWGSLSNTKSSKSNFPEKH